MDGRWKEILFFGSVCMLVPLQAGIQPGSFMIVTDDSEQHVKHSVTKQERKAEWYLSPASSKDVSPVSTTFGFILIKGEYDWPSALSYCRAHYQDLAIITSEKNATTINSLMASYPTRPAWIGLHNDGWKWSLPDGTAGVQFWNWQQGQPGNNGSDPRCVSMTADGLWRDDQSCRLVNLSFLCITEGHTNTYVLVLEGLSWVAAQTYCRLHYTDLASVRNLSENQDIQQTMQNDSAEVWIGLHRDSWMWSNGTNSSVSKWSYGEPDNAEACASVLNGTWNDTSCSTKLYFICQGYITTTTTVKPGTIPADPPLVGTVPPVVQRRTTVVKMKLTSNSDLEDPAVGDDLLRQLAAALKSRGVTDVTLTWRTLRKEPQPTKRDMCGQNIN